jgi:hypothetical protein
LFCFSEHELPNFEAKTANFGRKQLQNHYIWTGGSYEWFQERANLAKAVEKHIRVARFFLTRYTKNEGKYTKLPQHYQMAKNIPNDRKIYQMTVKNSKWQ